VLGPHDDVLEIRNEKGEKEIPASQGSDPLGSIQADGEIPIEAKGGCVKTKIEWSQHTWNPLKARLLEPVQRLVKSSGELKIIPAGKVGYHCEHISPGCIKCYAETGNGRCLPAWGTGLAYNVPNRDKVEIFIDEKTLVEPLKWKPGTVAFVCSMTDLFADFVPDELIDRVFAVMALCSGVTFQVLTKRANRMLKWSQGIEGMDGQSARDALIEGAAQALYAQLHPGEDPSMWLAVHQPLPNAWMGCSVESKKYADERIPLLLKTPAAIRFVSYEPALGPVDFQRFIFPRCMNCDALLKPAPNGREIGMDAALECGCKYCWHCADNRGRHECHDAEPPHGSAVLDWIIAGFESGPGARPAEVEWIRAVKNQCFAAGTAFFYKQSAIRGRKIPTPELDGQKWMQFPEVRV